MSNWKENLQKTRYVMDVVLLVSFMIVSAPQATGIMLHEWLSLLFIVPFAIHLMLHWDWIKKSYGQLFLKSPAKERFNIVWDFIIYIMMLVVFVSGFLVSVALLPAFNVNIQIQDFWSKIHHDSATLIMPMIGVHLALHWDWIITFTKKMISKRG
tara:strand:- start:12458 stop:12922 length:465 start_codon:yes stop_codon:yes gene_type:complete